MLSARVQTGNAENRPTAGFPLFMDTLTNNMSKNYLAHKSRMFPKQQQTLNEATKNCLFSAKRRFEDELKD